jgi:hypothetical protein
VLGAIHQRLAVEFPKTHNARGVVVRQLHDAMVGNVRPRLVIAAAVMVLVGLQLSIGVVCERPTRRSCRS